MLPLLWRSPTAAIIDFSSPVFRIEPGYQFADISVRKTSPNSQFMCAVVMIKFADRVELNIRMTNSIHKYVEEAREKYWDSKRMTVKHLFTCLQKDYGFFKLSTDNFIAKDSVAKFEVFENQLKRDVYAKSINVAFVSRTWFDAKKFVEGTLLFNVNKADINTEKEVYSKFEHISLKEMEFEAVYTPAHHILLLDLVTLEDNIAPVALSIPSKHFMVLGDYSRGVLRYCKHLSATFVNDIMFGNSLCYKDTAIEYSKGFIEPDNSPDFVITSNVYLSSFKGDFTSEVALNKQVYKSANSLSEGKLYKIFNDQN